MKRPRRRCSWLRNRRPQAGRAGTKIPCPQASLHPGSATCAACSPAAPWPTKPSSSCRTICPASDRSNAPLHKEHRLANSLVSQEHTIVDLGEDEFTVGRLHPMMDNDLRIRRLHQEADDPEVAVILLDVVLGYGAHPDPASELAPAIAQARAQAAQAGRHLEVVAVVVGTDEDPQDMDAQVEQLEAAGVRVETSNDAAVRYVGQLVRALNPKSRTKIIVLSDAKVQNRWICRCCKRPLPPSTSAWNHLPRACERRVRR